MAKDRVGLTYARTISYQEADFLSLNREIFRAIRYSKTILRGHKLRFVCDSQFDDEKTFHYIVRLCRDRTLLVPRSGKVREVLLEEFVFTISSPHPPPGPVRGGWSLAQAPGKLTTQRFRKMQGK